MEYYSAIKKAAALMNKTTDEPQTQWNQVRGHTAHDPIHTKCPEEQIRDNIYGCQWEGEQGSVL